MNEANDVTFIRKLGCPVCESHPGTSIVASHTCKVICKLEDPTGTFDFSELHRSSEKTKSSVWIEFGGIALVILVLMLNSETLKKTFTLEYGGVFLMVCLAAYLNSLGILIYSYYKFKTHVIQEAPISQSITLYLVGLALAIVPTFWGTATF